MKSVQIYYDKLQDREKKNNIWMMRKRMQQEKKPLITSYYNGYSLLLIYLQDIWMEINVWR